MTYYKPIGVDRTNAFPPGVEWRLALISSEGRADQLVDEARRGKLGRVGTSGRAVITLRYDHHLDPFIADILPLHRARALPFSIGVVTQAVGRPAGVPGSGYEPTTTTWSDIATEILPWGGELWAHSRTHANPAGTLYDEIVGSMLDIRSNLPIARCAGWQQPGGPSTYGEHHIAPSAMDDMAGRIIRAHFGLYETNLVGSAYRMLPTDGSYGLNHITVETWPLSSAKRFVDTAISLGAGLELMAHPGFIGRPGFMSLAEYEELLDYLVLKRDAGQIEVLTASGLAFADPSSDYRPSLIPSGDFEDVTTATPPAAYIDPGAAWEIRTDGGHSGDRCLRINDGSRAVSLTQPMRQIGLEGQAVMFEGFARLAGAGSVRPWVNVRGSRRVDDGTNAAGRAHYGPTLTSEWQQVRYLTTLPVGYHDVLISYGKDETTGTIEWDDVRVVAI